MFPVLFDIYDQDIYFKTPYVTHVCIEQMFGTCVGSGFDNLGF